MSNPMSSPQGRADGGVPAASALFSSPGGGDGGGDVSELFGAARGAFTGADRKRDGYFRNLSLNVEQTFLGLRAGSSCSPGEQYAAGECQ